MFVRKHTDRTHGTTYAVVESYRTPKGPRQRQLLKLGSHPTLESAVASWPGDIAQWREMENDVPRWRKRNGELETMYRGRWRKRGEYCAKRADRDARRTLELEARILRLEADLKTAKKLLKLTGRPCPRPAKRSNELDAWVSKITECSAGIRR